MTRRRKLGRSYETEIGERELRTLRMLAEHDGLEETARAIGVNVVTLLRVLAGFGDRCNYRSTQKVRLFFQEGG